MEITTITTAMPTNTYCCARFEITPAGFSARSSTCFGSDSDAGLLDIASPTLRLTLKGQVLAPDLQIALVNHFGNHVGSVPELEIDEVRFLVLDFVQGKLLGGGGLDVGELVVMVDSSHREWLLVVKAIVKLHLFGRVIRLEAGNGVFRLGLRHLHLRLISLDFSARHKLRVSLHRTHSCRPARFDDDLEVGIVGNFI